MTQAFEQIPAPGFVSPTATYTDSELLYSTQGGFTQVGVTLAGGQGVLPAGTVLGRNTTNKLYYVYNNTNTNGTEVARGVLRRAVDTGAAGTPNQQSNMVITGILRLDMVSGADAAALTDLGAVTDSVLNTFRF